MKLKKLKGVCHNGRHPLFYSSEWIWFGYLLHDYLVAEKLVLAVKIVIRVMFALEDKGESWKVIKDKTE